MPMRPPVHRPIGAAPPRQAAQQYNQARGSAASRGYGHRWRKVRAAWLAGHPQCCHPGCIQPATEVDHIVPHNGNYELMWSHNNFQGLCKPHHAAKTRLENPPGR